MSLLTLLNAISVGIAAASNRPNIVLIMADDLGGLFLGMGLGGKQYRPGEMLGLGLAMLGPFCLGQWALNTPFDPGHHRLPYLYFSAHWHWEPAKGLKPRPEVWGGLVFAFIGLKGYLA